MNPHLFPISRLSFLILILSCIPTPSASSDDQQYAKCGQPFHCGNIPNIGYPFWGGSRPEYCGHPSFGLNCQGSDAAPQITIQSRAYRVLAIDDTTQTLTVVRAEFWKNTCPAYLHNATLDTSHFNYIASDSQDLILYYGCPALPVGNIKLPYQFDCTTNGTNTASYYQTRSAVAVAVSALSSNFAACNTIVIVRVNQTASQALSNTTPSISVQQALDSGFGLRWEANSTDCNRCVGSGGRCGSNSSSFTCYCSDQPYPLTCNSTRNGSGVPLSPNSRDLVFQAFAPWKIGTWNFGGRKHIVCVMGTSRSCTCDI